MSRRRQIPWIHRMSRPLLAGVATLGALNTGYLTLSKFFGWHTICPTGQLAAVLNCDKVLSSPYASVFGLPLPLFGFLAYVSMVLFALAPFALDPDEQKELRNLVNHWTWLFLLIGATAMAVFSGYLMYLLAAVIKAGCVYCIASAITSVGLLVLVLIGREWESLGQIMLIGIATAMVALISTLGIYSTVNYTPGATPSVVGNAPPPVVATSGSAEIELARHLKQVGAKMYGAYWCPHCHDQKELLGKEANKIVPYIECAEDGQNAQPGLCKAANITGFPTWEINGQIYPGVQDLNKLADLSGYQGSRNFQNKL